MISYKKLKNETLNTYQKFSFFLKEFEETENIFKLPITKELELEFNRIATEIKNDKFKLMVLGEAKSGKSTFINAYLGIDLLPTDSLQCTSSIMKIRNGSNLKLKVIKADGTNCYYSEEKSIKEVLSKSGSLTEIEEKYKDIPVTRINNDIFLVRQGEKIYSRDINNFIESVKDEKIPSMTFEKYEELIKEYISEYKNSWKEIIKEIIIEYPFSLESIKEIEIIDSPGINAVGGLEEITKEYAKKVDAIMFLQSAEAPVENKLLKRMIEEYSTNRNTSFLIITKSGKLSLKELNEKIKEFHKYYENNINKDQIIDIDSIFQKYALFIEKKFEDYNRLEEYLDENEGNVEPTVERIIYRDREIEKIIENLRKKSKFDDLEKKLDLFGRKAQYYKLKSFLEKVLNSLEKINAKFLEQLSIFKIEDPERFEDKIKTLVNDIELLKNKISGSFTEISPEYTEELKNIIEKKLETIERKIKEEESEEIEKIFQCGVEEFIEFQKEFIKNKILDLNNRLIKLEKNKIEYKYLEPDITEEDFENIKENAKEKAKEIKEIETGFCFTTTKKVVRYSKKKYLEAIKNNIIERYEDISYEIREYMINYLNNTLEIYEKELRRNLTERKEELEKAKSLAEENDDKIEKIEILTKYKESFNICFSEVKKYIENINSVLN